MQVVPSLPVSIQGIQFLPVALSAGSKARESVVPNDPDSLSQMSQT
jgi:hypothetical protein